MACEKLDCHLYEKCQSPNCVIDDEYTEGYYTDESDFKDGYN